MLNGVKILRDLLVVQPLPSKKKSSGGFAMPEEVGADTGKVVAVGPEVNASSLGPEIKVGCTVYFGNESKVVSIKGNDYTVMESDNVIGIEEAKTEEL